MDFLKSIIIAFSFFSIIPMPMIKWTDRRMSFVPLILPIVGAAVGGLFYGLYLLLQLVSWGNLSVAVIMTVFLLVITGGVHADGLMDSADAYFSRREKAKKLEIMKDSRVGAFAVIAFFIVAALKIVFISELLNSGKTVGLILVFIPVISRILQPSMLYFFPFAKEEGLVGMYGGNLKKMYGYILFILFVVINIVILFLFGMSALAVPGVAVVYYIFYYFSSKKHFGGITGDLLGAYLEMAEMLMLGALLII